METNLEKLVCNYLPLAHKLASQTRKSLPKGLEIEDVVSAAYFGLVDAANKFKIDRNITFGTYARFRISGEIKDCIRNHCRMQKRFSSCYDEQGNCLFDSLAIEKQEEFGKIEEAFLSRLSERQQKIFDLYFNEQISLKEIGKRLNVGESRISQILKEIKSILNQEMTLAA